MSRKEPNENSMELAIYSTKNPKQSLITISFLMDNELLDGQIVPEILFAAKEKWAELLHKK